ncbi:MAG: HD domain-containing protein [Prevotellaceae bacterium]|jgi:HD superfamily phosphohydrolase|nr:HD domain-containing protein [Prevotellaceae bacterium]
MKNKRKIINDPVFGFINIPNEFLYDIIQHRFFQRLHRIKQLGVTGYVYPGAQHTRMQHSLGALYLTSEAVKELRSKGHEITEEEANGVMAAILLHDIGHGPYSHVLENTIIQGVSHEQISLLLMQKINNEMGGKLDLAIKIFQNRYHKKFLHQLVSSQLDMDRLDYLRRDSFFTGVVEGNIGSARIIKMLDVADDNLVIEQKGVHSIENYLMARRFMYWQVYLHKTSIATEIMLIKILERAKFLHSSLPLTKGEETETNNVRENIAISHTPSPHKWREQGRAVFATPSLSFFLSNNINAENFCENPDVLEHFVNIDDSDIISAIKVWTNHSDKVLSILCKNFVNRVLFKTLEQAPMTEKQKQDLQKKYSEILGINLDETVFFFSEQTLSSNTYEVKDDKIFIQFTNGAIRDIAEVSDILNPAILNRYVQKHLLCYLKI